MNWAGLKPFFLIFLVFLLFTNPLVCSYKTLLHNETEPGLEVYQILSYKDKTSVLFLKKSINETCNEPRIDLRVIHPDGAVDKVNVDHSIPDFNFCLKPNDTSSLYIKLFNKLDNIIILYENSTDVNLASFYALIVNGYTGNVISDSFISPISVFGGELSHTGNIYPHISDEHGFLFRTFTTWTKMLLIYFNNPDENGNLEQINRDELELHSQVKVDTFAAVDGAFILVTSNYTVPDKPYYDSENELDPALSLYISFIKPEKNVHVDGPHFIYKTEAHSIVELFACNIAYATLGNTCLLSIKKPQAIGEPKGYLVEINFLSIGTLISSKNISESYDFGEIINLVNLYYGGYLILSLKSSNNTPFKTIQATVLDNNGTYSSTLLPENLKVPNNLATSLSLLQNNTLAIPQQENENAWKLYVTDEYPRFIYYGNDCNVPFVQSTYPLVDSYIPLSSVQINITYQMPVVASTNNISIYQYSNKSSSVLRQTSKFSSQSLDGKTLILDTLGSTFNKPSTDYYVVIDDDTVRDVDLNEALTGIKKNIWKFSTIDKQYNITEDSPTTGILALTSEGAEDYDGLSRHDQKEFLKKMRVDLAESIPIDDSRLSDISFYQYDKSYEPPRIFFELTIKSANNEHDQSVEQIINNLDILIKRKDITSISRFDSTKNLDITIGFSKKRNICNDFKVYLISIASGAVVLILFYCFARKVFPWGDNIILIKNPLVIMDFVLDIYS